MRAKEKKERRGEEREKREGKKGGITGFRIELSKEKGGGRRGRGGSVRGRKNK